MAERLNIVCLDLEQRARASQLEKLVSNDPTIAAYELICLRDQVGELRTKLRHVATWHAALGAGLQKLGEQVLDA